jgi:hypothetical protein
MQGGDRVDADGNPLSTIPQWQKQSSGPGNAARPRFLPEKFDDRIIDAAFCW